MVKTVIKRDGSRVDFRTDKITTAIRLAGERTGEFDEKEAERLAYKVTEIVNEEYGEELSVENVQDLVESVLLDSQYKATAKSYIIYREMRNRERNPDIFK